MNALLEAALRYAAHGWPVVACHHPLTDGRCSCRNPACDDIGKHPRYDKDDLPNGLHSVTTDPTLIERWWQRWPQANIAIATGERSQLLVLDSDQAGLYQLPTTATVRTARGAHAYLLLPQGAALRTRIGLLPHLDVRAHDGMAIAPPSLHATGARYTWEIEAPLLPPPRWLLALLEPAPLVADLPQPQAPVRHVDVQDGKGIIRLTRAYAHAALAGELAQLRAATPGTRNRTLNWVAFRAGQFVGAGFLEARGAEAAITAAALRSGLPLFEITKTLASRLAAGQDYPATCRAD